MKKLILFSLLLLPSIVFAQSTKSQGTITFLPNLRGIQIYTPSASTTVVAGTGLTVTKTIQRVIGNGGAVTVTATPNIADGVDGQIVIIQGTNDTNTVEFQDADNLANSGLALAGSVNFTLGKGDTLELTYDAGDDLWYEISRSDN